MTTPHFHGEQPTGRLVSRGPYMNVYKELKANGFYSNAHGVFGKVGSDDQPSKVIELRYDHAGKEWHAYSKPGQWNPAGSDPNYTPQRKRKPRKRRRVKR